MVEKIDDLPAGVIGFRISGKITHDEYHELVDPVREALDRGEKVRYLVETAPDFHGLDAGALWQDVKAGASIGLGHRSSWERCAVVTDKDWMRQAISAFGWLSPGELRIYEPSELDAAKAWLGDS